MCVIHFHPRVASIVASVFRLVLRYGWIPCMLFIYIFPPHQQPTVLRDERAISGPEMISARLVTDKPVKAVVPRPRIELPKVNLPSIERPAVPKLPAVPSIKQIISTFTMDAERKELYSHYGNIQHLWLCFFHIL